MLRFLTLLVLLACLPIGCASTGGTQASNAPGQPLTIVLAEYRNSLRMTLVSDRWMRENGVPGEDFAHRRAAFYSQRSSGDNLMVKVVEDKIADGVWDHLWESGFAQYGKSGAAPEAGGNVVQALEVQTTDGPIHMSGYPGMDTAEGEAYKFCKLSYMDVYNAVLQLQTVDRLPKSNVVNLKGQR